MPLLESADHNAVHEFIEPRAFATRIPSFIQDFGETLTARNILTQIDKMNKKYIGFRTAYDHLSDFVHPNGLGAVVHFVSIENGIATFHDSGKNPNWALSDLIASGLLLGYMEVSIGEIEQRLT
jgi:hypothetical protein